MATVETPTKQRNLRAVEDAAEQIAAQVIGAQRMRARGASHHVERHLVRVIGCDQRREHRAEAKARARAAELRLPVLARRCACATRFGGRGASAVSGASDLGHQSVPDAGVDHRVEQIDSRLEKTKMAETTRTAPCTTGIVAVQDALDQDAAEPLMAKTFSTTTAPGHQQREGDAHHRHDRDQRIREGVAQQHVGSSALGRGDAHVVRVQHLQHGRTDHARDDRGKAGADGDGGQIRCFSQGQKLSRMRT